jgi:hypothetical protein
VVSGIDWEITPASDETSGEVAVAEDHDLKISVSI